MIIANTMASATDSPPPMSSAADDVHTYRRLQRLEFHAMTAHISCERTMPKTHMPRIHLRPRRSAIEPYGMARRIFAIEV